MWPCAGEKENSPKPTEWMEACWMGFSLAFIILDFLGNMGESVGPASSVYLFLFPWAPWANLQKSPSSKPRMLSGKGVVFLGTADNSRCLNKKNKLPFKSSTFATLHWTVQRKVAGLQCGSPCESFLDVRWLHHIHPYPTLGVFQDVAWRRCDRLTLARAYCGRPSVTWRLLVCRGAVARSNTHVGVLRLRTNFLYGCQQMVNRVVWMPIWEITTLLHQTYPTVEFALTNLVTENFWRLQP